MIDDLARYLEHEVSLLCRTFAETGTILSKLQVFSSVMVSWILILDVYLDIEIVVSGNVFCSSDGASFGT